MPQHRLGVVGDIERYHRLAPGAVGMAVDHRHHRAHPLGQRRVGRVAVDLVVLDEVDAGGAERIDQLGGLLRRQPDARLDDGADQRPAMHAGHVARAGGAKRGAWELRRVIRRQIQIEHAQAGDVAKLEQIAGDGGHQVGQVGADIGDRKADFDDAPAIRPGDAAALRVGADQRRRRDHLQRFDRNHARARTRLEFVGLARHGHERAARLLAGDCLGHAV